MHKDKHKFLVKLIPALIASIGAIVGLSFIGLVAEETQSMMIIAPFGATAILIFSLPDSPSSKPLSVFGGYLLASIVGAIALLYSSGDWLFLGIGFGVVLFVMQVFDIIHPPAGAHYIVVTQGTLTIQSIEPLFVGLIALVVMGLIAKQAQRLLR